VAIPMLFAADLMIVLTGQFILPIMFQIKLVPILLVIAKFTQEKTNVLSLILMELIIQEEVTTNPEKDVKIKHLLN